MQEVRVSDTTREKFIKAWMKYDPDATGFIKVNDLPEMILDLTEEEYHIKLKDGTSDNSLTVFNFTNYPELKILMKVVRNKPLVGIEN